MRRMQFGRSSEKIARAADQLELMLEEVEASAAAALAPAEDGASDGAAPKRNRARRPLPPHLPRTARWSTTAPVPVLPAAERCARSAKTSPRSSITSPAAFR
ncbi:hypothetical protein MCP1_1070001 [Candidatus Terasakiella magnetica]|nr:hypothetical protein MCP1_1070001 [Candidatus Terasakiella magnetica]